MYSKIQEQRLIDQTASSPFLSETLCLRQHIVFQTMHDTQKYMHV